MTSFRNKNLAGLKPLFISHIYFYGPFDLNVDYVGIIERKTMLICKI